MTTAASTPSPSLFESLELSHGPRMPNRLMLAPMTNLQSHLDGTLSEDEFRWLTMRAQGGFGMTMTCASHVHPGGKGFVGQLGCFDDAHVEGLSRLARAIRDYGSVSSVQLHHAGMRSPEDLIDGQPVCPSDDEDTNSRALTNTEVHDLIEAFIQAAQRADRAGMDGVEIHGAHGYLICQFLSPEINRRSDDYGGSLENRSRFLFEIVRGIRERCRPDFQVGVRLSPERFGMKLDEVLTVSQRLFDERQIDYLDASLWDVFKEPHDAAFHGRSLLSYFLDLKRGDTRLGAAGKIHSAADARRCLEQGLDFVTIGRSAILHHDFPRECELDPEFVPVELPVSPDYLSAQGLGPAFVEYLRRWNGLVE